MDCYRPTLDESDKACDCCFPIVPPPRAESSLQRIVAILIGSLGLEAMSDCSFGVDAVSCISEGDLDTIHFFLIW